MNVAVCVITLRLVSVGTLKEKRGLVRSLLDRARQRFNVSVAEVGSHDSLRTAVLGLSCVASGALRAQQMASSVTRFVEAESLGQAEVVESHTEVLSGFSD